MYFEIENGFQNLDDALRSGKLKLKNIGTIATQILNVTAHLH